MMRVRVLIPFLIVLLAGCDQFATPAELASPQILALRAEPPAVPPGGSAALDILVADASGVIASPVVTWKVTPSLPDELPLGQIEPGAGGTAIYTAPAELAMSPAVAAVTATVFLPDDELTAIKAVIIGDLALQNPALTAFTVDGEDRLAQPSLTLEVDQVVRLQLATQPAIDEMSLFAWYCTVGAIAQYQSNPVELVAQDEPGSGWLFAVMRDGRGGVVWHAVAVTVQ
jgi:hypothetical protein